MKDIKNGAIIWVMTFFATATFDLLMYNITNGDFDFDYTILFACVMCSLSFMTVYNKSIKTIKFKKRKDFVTTLDNAIRVKRVKK